MTDTTANRESGARLESWKEIAAHLQRDVSTVRRWEKCEGLPVHRHEHTKRSSVYAYASELDTWRQARAPGADSSGQPTRWRWAALAPVTLVFLVAVWVVARGPILSPPNPLAEAAEEGGIQIRQVWAGVGVDSTGNPWPGGRFLTYTDWAVANLAVKDLETGESRLLTTQGTWSDPVEFPQYSRVSRDGRYVAYDWFNKDKFWELRLISWEGGEPRTLYRNPETNFIFATDWSPDGKLIAVVHELQDRSQQIATISIDDGAIQVLRTFDWRQRPGAAKFSSDGRYLVYSIPGAKQETLRDIRLIAIDGSEDVPLVEHPADDELIGWSPQGDHVLFLSDRSGTKDVWALEVKGSKPASTPVRLRRDVGDIQPMGLSQTGSLFFSQGRDRIEDIFVVEVDTAAARVLTPPELAVDSYVGTTRKADWSPDGKHLAYISERKAAAYTPGSRNLLIRDLETGWEREFPPELRGVSSPTWSPDGSKLAVYGIDEANRKGFYAIDVESGRITPIVPRLLSGEDLGGRAYWSKYGNAIFYLSRDWEDENARIVRRHVETGTEQTLHSLDYLPLPFYMDVSPDGRLLAASINTRAKDLHGIFLIPTHPGSVRKLLDVRDGIARDGLVWSPDGRYLLYIRTIAETPRSYRDELWRVPLDGGSPAKFELQVEGRMGDLRIHPNGRRIAFTRTQNYGEVWEMSHFLPGSRSPVQEDAEK